MNGIHVLVGIGDTISASCSTTMRRADWLSVMEYSSIQIELDDMLLSNSKKCIIAIWEGDRYWDREHRRNQNQTINGGKTLLKREKLGSKSMSSSVRMATEAQG